MRCHRLLLVTGVLLAASASCGGRAKGGEIPRSDTPLTAKEIVERSSAAIVRIEATGNDGEQFGTGFIVDKSGVVATNFHVIAGTTALRLKLHDGTIYPVMSVLNVDPVRDLALIKFVPPRPMPALRLGDSDTLSAGDQIVAIGNPLGVFDYSVSAGLVSQVRPLCTQEQVEIYRRNEAEYQRLATKENKTAHEEARLSQLGCPAELKLLQISAPISQGSSGGPLFNQVGEVVGVTTAIIAQGQLINFAMPANYLKPLIANQQPIAFEDFAKATRKEITRSAIERAPYSREGFPAAVYDGCKPDQVGEVVKAIEEAIAVGAPLYNQGEIEACFRIYEGTATKIERDAPCKGVGKEFGDGLLKASALVDFKAKAWAMRDTFDGFLIAAEKWKSNSGSKPRKK